MRHAIKNVALALLGAIGGGGAGLILSIAAGMLIGIVNQALHPDDLSAGSAAEIMIVLAPLAILAGAIAGAVLGWKFASRRRHG